MKKLTIILMVLSVFMTMTQCKKDLQVHSGIADDAIFIHVDVNNGSKVNVNTTTGNVGFEENDVLHVVNNGKYVGYLRHNGTAFEGTISGAVKDTPLYFYFLGNQEVDRLSIGATYCSVSIEDQSNNLPVISFGRANQVFLGEGSYSVFLYNKCALVKFNVIADCDKSVSLIGMNNNVCIDFGDNSFIYNKSGEGIINLPAGSGEKWAIVFPQSELSEGESGSLFSEDEKLVGVRPAIPAIEANDFIEDAIDLVLHKNTINDGTFTASRAKKVTFSPGNLQYVHDGSKCSWQFAKKQYDIVGMGQNGTASQDVSRDLYGWGTGDNPCNVSTSDSDYSTFVDWGAVMGQKDGKESWRTLTGTEWDYIVYRRKASTVNGIENARYTKAVVNGVNGMILFPDVYVHPTDVKLPEAINYTTSNQSWDANVYSEKDWELMEKAGAMFLPAAGSRIGTSVENVGEVGRYWSSYTEDDSHAFNLFFTDYRPYPTDKVRRSEGFSVRLVHE